MKKTAVLTGVSMIAIAGYIVAQQQGVVVLQGDVIGGNQSSALSAPASSAISMPVSSSASSRKYCCLTGLRTCLSISSPEECGNVSKNIYDTQEACDLKCAETSSSTTTSSTKPAAPTPPAGPVCPGKSVTTKTPQTSWYFQAVNVQYPDYAAAEAQAQTNVTAQLLSACATNPTVLANIRCDVGCTGDGQPSFSLTNSAITCQAQIYQGYNGAYCTGSAQCSAARTCKKI